MNGVIIGNCISVVAACFTAAGSWTMSKEKSFLYQTGQCLVLAVASVFFQSWSGITTLLLCAVRNYLLAKDRFHGPLVAVYLTLTTGLSILVNNRGAVGWILIIATIIYTIASIRVQKPLAVKINIMINLSLWMLYEVLILDLVSFVTDAVVLILTIVSIVRVLMQLRRDKKQRGMR